MVRSQDRAPAGTSINCRRINEEEIQTVQHDIVKEQTEDAVCAVVGRCWILRSDIQADVQVAGQVPERRRRDRQAGPVANRRLEDPW